MVVTLYIGSIIAFITGICAFVVGSAIDGALLLVLSAVLLIGASASEFIKNRRRR